MSVAFRRESDEEHKEPKFELPLPPGPNLVTRRGLVLIEAKVAELESRIASLQLEPEIEEAKRALRYWLTRQSTAQLAPPPEPDVASFGTRVTFKLNGRQRIVDIVGDDEAEPDKDRLSFSAPPQRGADRWRAGRSAGFQRQGRGDRNHRGRTVARHLNSSTGRGNE